MPAEPLPVPIGQMLWGLLGFLVVCFFVSSYVTEVLAQKLDQPRWMAWVPIVNGYLMLRLVGWETWFWMMAAGIAISLGCVFLPPPLPVLAVLPIIGIAVAALVILLAYWPTLARHRGLSAGVGLLILLAGLLQGGIEFTVPGSMRLYASLALHLISFGAYFWIAFHDGGPRAGPHPIGYVVTAGAVLVGAMVVGKLTGWLEQSGALPELEYTREAAPEGNEIGEDLLAALRRGLDQVKSATRSAAQTPAALVSDAPARVADECPDGAREAGARPPHGLEWWCEVETPSGSVRQGPSRRWLNARIVAEEGEYREGRRHGTWTRYWPTGGRHTQAEFRDGAQHGWMSRWDEAGRLESRTYFRDGKPDALAAPSA